MENRHHAADSHLLAPVQAELIAAVRVQWRPDVEPPEPVDDVSPLLWAEEVQHLLTVHQSE
jgi:hypothetical protein